MKRGVTTSGDTPVFLQFFANDRYGASAAWLRNLPEERRTIELALQGAVAVGACRLAVDTNTTHRSFFDQLDLHRRAIIGLHFAGHADPDGLHFEDTEGRPVPARMTAIADALAELPALRWVFLNGCGTERHVDVLHSRLRVPVIATRAAIRDDIAFRFAHRFYFGLAGSASLAEAFRSAERDITSEYDAPATWGPQQPDARPADGAEHRHVRPVAVSPDRWPWVLRLPPQAPKAGSWRLMGGDESEDDGDTRRGYPTPPDSIPGPDTADFDALLDRETLDEAAPTEGTGTGDTTIAVDKAVGRAAVADVPSWGRVHLAGRTLGGKYRLETRIGRGAFGVVYKGVQEPLGRTVAVKISLSGHGADPRFRREAEVLARLRHEHIVQLIDYGEEHDPDFGPMVYMVQEFVDGRTLKQVLGDVGALDPGRAVHVLSQILVALEAAHDEGVVHRDIKPANVIIAPSESGDVRVLDFGIAKTLDDESVTGNNQMGTPAYMSPEQCRADPIGPPADLYAVGVLLHRCLTGRLPFESRHLPGYIHHHLNTAPPRLDKSLEPFDRVVQQAMAKDPARRYESAGEMRRALAVALTQWAANAASVGAGPLSKRLRLFLAVACVAAAIAWTQLGGLEGCADPPPESDVGSSIGEGDDAPATGEKVDVGGSNVDARNADVGRPEAGPENAEAGPPPTDVGVAEAGPPPTDVGVAEAGPPSPPTPCEEKGWAKAAIKAAREGQCAVTRRALTRHGSCGPVRSRLKICQRKACETTLRENQKRWEEAFGATCKVQKTEFARTCPAQARRIDCPTH